MSNYRRYVSEALDTHLLWLALPHSNRELAEATLRASRLSSPPLPPGAEIDKELGTHARSAAENSIDST